MSGERSQKVTNVDGVIYDAVTFRGWTDCRWCDLSSTVACDRVGCFPEDRDDRLWAIWKRRVTNTPVEGL